MSQRYTEYMRILLAVLLPVFAPGLYAAGFGEETSARDKYVSPSADAEEAQNYIFDRRGNPTVYKKKESKDKKAKKKVTEEKKKKLTKKPGKRRPQSAGGKKSPAKTKTPETDDFDQTDGEDAAPEKKPEAPKQDDGQGLDYGGVNLEDDSKPAIPDGDDDYSPPPDEGGEDMDPAFRPAPPEVE